MLPIKFGRKAPTHFPHPSAKQFAEVVKPLVLPVPPVSMKWSPIANPTPGLNDILGNDTLSDCVPAAIGHSIDALRFRAQNGAAVVEAGDALGFYERACGYVPGQNDPGCELFAALSYWNVNGYFANGGSKASGGVGWVDATNKLEIKQAIWLMEAVQIGMYLPDAWVSAWSGENGFVWDVAGAPDPEHSHCVAALSYSDSLGVCIVSWGCAGYLTWAALAEYGVPANGGEVYVSLDPNIIMNATGKSPNEFTEVQLGVDMTYI